MEYAEFESHGVAVAVCWPDEVWQEGHLRNFTGLMLDGIDFPDRTSPEASQTQIQMIERWATKAAHWGRIVLEQGRAS